MRRESMPRWRRIATALVLLLVNVVAAALGVFGVELARAQTHPHIVSVSGIPASKRFSGYSKVTVNSSDAGATTKVEFRWSRVCYGDGDDTTAPFFYEFNANQCPDG